MPESGVKQSDNVITYNIRCMRCQQKHRLTVFILSLLTSICGLATAALAYSGRVDLFWAPIGLTMIVMGSFAITFSYIYFVYCAPNPVTEEYEVLGGENLGSSEESAAVSEEDSTLRTKDETAPSVEIITPENQQEEVQDKDHVDLQAATSIIKDATDILTSRPSSTLSSKSESDSAQGQSSVYASAEVPKNGVSQATSDCSTDSETKPLLQKSDTDKSS